MARHVIVALVTVVVTLNLIPPRAVVYVPPGYDGGPTPILYWLHWYNGSAHHCPYFEMEPDCIVVAPLFRREADWKNYDLEALVRDGEQRWPASERWIEGYSRGAYGAAWHAAQRPELFSKVTAIAGGYPDHPEPPEIQLFAGARDDRWLESSREYAAAIGSELTLVDSSHDPWEFYSKLGNRYASRAETISHTR